MPHNEGGCKVCLDHAYQRGVEAERAHLREEEWIRKLTAERARSAALQAILTEVVHIHGHQRVSDFMNQFTEWRRLISRARAALSQPAPTEET